MTLDDKISKNIAMTYEANDTLCKKDEIIETFYKLKDEKLHQWRCSVIKEAVVLGNSYAAAQFSGIYQALKLLGYTKAYLIARSGCLPHGGELNKEYSDPNYGCNEWIKNSFDEFLITVKPEMLIISARYSMFKHLMDPLPSADLYAKDFAIQELRNGIVNLSNFSRTLLFISPNADFDFSHIKVDEPRLSHLKSMINFTYNSASTIARNLQLNLSLDEFVLSKEYVYEITHASEVRLIEAIKDCSNCLFFNTTELFCDNNGCPLYDKKTQLAILRDQSHLSTIGVEMLTKPLFNFMSLKIT
uniref:SGNH domain-containing protein n=1 Tax=Panagrolaimus davidi TaxID=227884 RepID=A0A914P4W6_9BILA